MIDQQKFHEFLENEGVKFITGVPDSLLNDFCLYASTNLPNDRHVIAANEGNAIALAVGNHIATGNVPLVYMQNSGLGNAINPLLSLTNKEVYAIPLVLLIGWRGDPEIKDHAHHKKQGELTPILLNSMGIPYKVIENDSIDYSDIIHWAVKTATELSGPTAILAKKGTLTKIKKQLPDQTQSKFEMNREIAIHCILENVPAESIFIATTGRATRELYELRNILGQNHNLDFLNVGSMGHCSSIATGIALAAKNRLIVCLDGDAAVIMHLGSLTTAGKLKPSNLLHVVLNNGVHESVGGQPSAGFIANLTKIAENSGYKTIGNSVNTKKNLEEAIKELLDTDGPKFIDIHIRQGIRSDIPFLKVSHIDSKYALMKELNKK